MHKISMAILAVALPLLSSGVAVADEARQSFGFESADISGANGSARLSGGGSYDQVLRAIKGGGAFRCTNNIDSGLLNGCKAGEGVRWDPVALLDSTGLKCGTEAARTVFTGDGTVVLIADFYRQGDGDVASFTAK